MRHLYLKAWMFILDLGINISNKIMSTQGSLNVFFGAFNLTHLVTKVWMLRTSGRIRGDITTPVLLQ